MLNQDRNLAPAETGYKNVSLLFVAIFGIVFLGFFKTYFGLFPSFNNVTAIQHIHGLLFTTWFVLLFVQPLLIRYGKYRAHRTIGRFTYVLVPCIIISIHFIAREAYLNAVAAHRPRPDILAGTYFQVYQIFDFAILYLLAIINKHRTPYHMRYMIATSLAIVGAGMRRLFAHILHMDAEALLLGFLIPDLFLLGLIVYDLIKGNNARAYIIAFVILAVSHYSFYWLPHSALWQSVAGYFVRFF
ncbi:MAG TPA: hypothetical protein VHB54_16085 [Mucilaginibacter sp.]|nr:hypothetical protein [Mucilaginibacter sp.]